MNRARLILTFAGLLAATAPAGAQGRGRGQDDVPPGHRPPAGMCRIWLDGVPAGQQPAPTDCVSALRNRPSNGRVIFGDEPKDKGTKWKKKDDRRRDRTDDVYERDQAAGGMPDMRGGLLAARGIRTPDVRRLLGDADVVARTVDADRDGMPERISWHDARSGALVQVWTDRDHDGRADQVDIFRDGKRIRTLGAP